MKVDQTYGARTTAQFRRGNVITRSPFAAALFSTANVDYDLLLTNIPQVEPPQSENFGTDLGTATDVCAPSNGEACSIHPLARRFKP
jgi:hypothetical protein